MPVLTTTIAAAGAGVIASGAALFGVMDLDQETPVIPCGAVFERLPADLQDDLTGLGELPAGPERMAAVTEIRTAALDGDYGPRVDRFATRVQRRARATWKRLPVDLRGDIAGLRDLPADERRAAADAIRDDALAGEYGDRVQRRTEERVERAERLRERWASCQE